jgi:hypothetical protein
MARVLRAGRWRIVTGRVAVAAVAFAALAAPATIWAGACDDQLGEAARVTGRYVAAGQLYAQTFVFAVVVDCHGMQEIVTVQRPTGNLPVCARDQPVEVVGKLVWNRALVDGHYEINGPSKVVCGHPAPAKPAAVASQDTPPAVPAVPSPPTKPQRPETGGLASSAWIGRYHDNRGTGEISLTLVRGFSAVSGIWKARTGGGGPFTGTLESDARRLQFRMESLAPECPGILQGAGELTDNSLVGTYGGQDCEGSVTDGQLELRMR